MAAELSIVVTPAKVKDRFSLLLSVNDKNVEVIITETEWLALKGNVRSWLKTVMDRVEILGPVDGEPAEDDVPPVPAFPRRAA